MPDGTINFIDENNFEITRISTHPNSFGDVFTLFCNFTFEGFNIHISNVENHSGNLYQQTSFKNMGMHSTYCSGTFCNRYTDAPMYADFDIQCKTQSSGIGTLLLDATFEICYQYQLRFDKSILYLSGSISTADNDNGNWEQSIPFYWNYTQHMFNGLHFHNNVRTELLYYKEHKQNIALSIEDFKNQNCTGIIKYIIED